MKKYLLISFLFLSAIFNFAQTATAPSGSGTEADPYLIANLENLYWITQDKNRWIGKYYKQTANIDASDTRNWTWTDDSGNDATGFKSIGNISQSFTGSYDGQGYSIDGLYIKRNTASNIGMFGNIYNATVKNISLTNLYVESYYDGTDANIQYDWIGGLVGQATSSTISNCNTSGSVSGGGQVGGLIGAAGEGDNENDGNSVVENCSSTCNVTGVFWIGGLIGQLNAGIVKKCSSSGTVKAQTNNSGEDPLHAGGFIGRCEVGTDISECHSTGNVSGKYYVGGFTSLANGSYIKDCYSKGDVSGYRYIGGFSGRNIDETGERATIDNCFSTGKVSGDYDFGGFVGYYDENEDDEQVINCFWDTETSGQTTSAGGTGKTTAEMQTQSTFTDAGWDFTNIWYMNGYPDLLANPLPVELTTFTAVVSNRTVVLNWETATEVNNYGFEIERSLFTNSEWKKIGFVEGHGNSNITNKYSFIDSTVELQKYLYRLKQIDTDGTYEYSVNLVVDVTNPNAVQNDLVLKNFKLEQNYPNPFNPETTIKYQIPNNERQITNSNSQNAIFVSLKIYNILGREVTTLVNEMKNPGEYFIKFNGSNLASGIYYYTLSVGNFSETKKMILSK